MLSSVELRNFKTHVHSVVELDNLVSFIGPNDAGKSNIVTAINMVVLNEPFPERYLHRSSGATEGEVTLKFCNGRRITRWRKGKKQGADLYYEDGRHEAYATTKDLDALIAEFTGFHTVSLDGKSKAECIQIVPLSESSVPFLISGNTPAVVLRKVNMLAAGAKIEQAKVLLESEIRKREKLLDERRAVAVEIETQIEALEAPVWSKIAKQHDVLKDAIEEAEAIPDALEDIAVLLTDYAAAKKAQKDVVRIDSLIKELAGVRTVAAKARQEHDGCSSTITEINAVQQSYVGAVKELEDAEEAETSAEKALQKAQLAMTLVECTKCGRMAQAQ